MVRGNVIFSEKAATDVASIGDWYNQQKNELANEFLESLDEALDKIKKYPSSFNFINAKVRKCKLKRFPYYVYFFHQNGIDVLRVRHVKQNPLKRFT